MSRGGNRNGSRRCPGARLADWIYFGGPVEVPSGFFVSSEGAGITPSSAAASLRMLFSLFLLREPKG